MCLIFQNPSQLTLSLYSELTALNAIWSLTRARQNIQLTVMTCIAVKMPQMQETIRIKRSWAQNLHIWCTNKHRIRTIRKATALISQFPSLLFIDSIYDPFGLWSITTLVSIHIKLCSFSATMSFGLDVNNSIHNIIFFVWNFLSSHAISQNLSKVNTFIHALKDMNGKALCKKIAAYIPTILGFSESRTNRKKISAYFQYLKTPEGQNSYTDKPTQ